MVSVISDYSFNSMLFLFILLYTQFIIFCQQTVNHQEYILYFQFAQRCTTSVGCICRYRFHSSYSEIPMLFGKTGTAQIIGE